MPKPNDDFEAFRGDLIAYLALKLQLSREAVAAKLGDSLIEELAGADSERPTVALARKPHPN